METMYLLQTVGHRYYVEIADNEKKLGLVLIGTHRYQKFRCIESEFEKIW